MIRRFMFAIGGVLLCSTTAFALSVEPGDAGEVYQFQTRRAHFVLINDHETEVTGIRIKPVRNADVVVSAPERMAPGQRVDIEVDLNAGDDFGTRQHMFLIESKEAATTLVGRVRLYGLSVVDDPGVNVDFGQVDVGATPSKSYQLVSDDPKLRIVGVTENPAFAEATIADDGRGLVLRHLSDSPIWGKQFGVVRVKLDSPLQRELAIPVVTEIRGPVVPSSLVFELGLIRAGSKNDYIIQYRHADGKPFTLEDVKLDGIAGTVSTKKCVGDEKGCRQVHLLIDDSQTKGQLRGQLTVKVPEYDRRILVHLGGMLVAKDTKIESLDEALKAQKNAVEASRPNLEQALNSMKSAQQPLKPTIPEGHGPLLQWTVSNEANTYGYAIYRAESESGPFAMQGPIVRRSALSKDGVPSSYAVRDNEAVAGKEYWYRIAVMQSSGKHEFLGAAQRVKARAAAEDERGS